VVPAKAVTQAKASHFGWKWSNGGVKLDDDVIAAVRANIAKRYG